MTVAPRKETISSRIWSDLRGQILRAELAPDEKINLETLRERFQTSISPLREALSRLTADGLVLFEDQRGFRVAPVSREEYADLGDLRAEIATVALRGAIACGDMDWESGIVRTLHRLRRTPADGALGNWQQAHDAFHHALTLVPGRPVLQRTVANLVDLSRRYRALAGLEGDGETGPASHEVIAAAAIRRDAAAAVAALRAHLQDEMHAVLVRLDRLRQNGEQWLG